MPIVVSGMHRSGTSAVTRVLGGAGFDLGPQELLMPGSDANVHGHFELLPIVALNDALLAEVGARWLAPTHGHGATALLANGPLGTQARELVRTHRLGPATVVKDPRFSLTLPFWRSVFDDDITVVLVVRHPHEVARSLEARDRFPAEYSLLLWEAYNRRLLAAAQGLRCVVVSYEDLMTEPGPTVRQLLVDLGDDNVSKSTAERAAAFVDAGIRNHAATGTDNNTLAPSTLRLWEQLSTMRAGVVAEQATPEAADSDRAALFETAAAAYGYRSAEDARRDRESAEFEARLAEFETKRDAVEAADKERIQALQLNGRLLERVETADDEIAAAVQQIADLTAERDAARADLAETIERLTAERDAARADLALAIERLTAERDTARADLAETEERLTDERDAARRAVVETAERLEADRDKEHDRAEAIRQETRQELAELASKLERSRINADLRDRQRVEQLEQRIRELAQAETQDTELRAQVSGLKADIAGYQRDLRIADAERQRIAKSRSGRALLRSLRLRDRFSRNTTARGSADGDAPVVTAAATLGGPSPLPPPVSFPTVEDPLVSIIVPVYGQLAFTANCLASIAADPTLYDYEVIVVNDTSPDRSIEWLDTCSGVVVVDNPQNLGFTKSTNAGAAVARGAFLCLLNNDTTVHAGWLDALVGTFRLSPGIGAVGAKLVYPDGTLQEAGTIIWSDASGWNFGRNGDANAPEVNFVREVDYCSAACLLVKADLFARLGGFDERYAPAYYEDSDLAFGLRSLGYRTLYQPAAVVTHHEGISHGTDESQGLKAHQVTNRVAFSEKWAAELANHHGPTTNPRLASWRGEGKRVVVIDHEVPAEDHDSGSVRMTAILDLLVEAGLKTTFVPRNRFRREPYASLLQARGVEVIYGHRDFVPYLQDVANEIAMIIVSRPAVAAEFVPILTAALPTVPVVYDMVDFHGLRIERRGDATEVDEQRHATAMRELELALVRSVDLTLAVSADEAAEVARIEPDAAIDVVPNIHRSPLSAAPFGEREGLLFVGSFRHPPNSDAITFLADEIMPKVWQQAPHIGLHLVGSDMPDDLVDTNGLNITMHGWVPDLDALFDTVRVSVAPLRFGAGLKGKVGDSMIRGVPVVATPVGAEGFGPTAEFIQIGNTAQELADLIVELHEDPELWERLASSGVRSISENFGYEAARRALTRVIAALDTN